MSLGRDNFVLKFNTRIYPYHGSLATNRESPQNFNQLKDNFRFQLFLKSIFFKTVKNLFKNQSQRVVLQSCSALVTFWSRSSARSCLHPNLFLPSSLHDKILRILGINIKNEKMSQNIENLIFFIREKLHLVGLFTFTKFEQHLSNIRMNRHISKSQSGNLYSISLTGGVAGPFGSVRAVYPLLGFGELLGSSQSICQFETQNRQFLSENCNIFVHTARAPE